MIWYEAHFLYSDPKTTRECNWENANKWGKGRASRLMQCYRMREGGCSFHIDLARLTRVEWMRQESWTQEGIEKRSFWPPWHAWDLNAWCSCDGSFLYLFETNLSSHNSRGVDWLIRHLKLTTLYIVSYEIKYTAARLSCVRSKIQLLCLIHCALDLGDTCWDELLTAWFLQVQQIFIKDY
jgi:hypothetical protein